MGAAASVNNTETTRNEFMLQRQKPVNGTDVKDMNGALQEIAKLRTLCRIVDPTDLDQFLEKFNHVDPTAVRGNPSHDFKIVHSNISSVPNPILPNNRAPDLMPTVHASDIQGHINNFILNPVAPSEGGGASRPSSPLKPCLKSHARAHSAAKKKRVFIAENGNTVQDALKYNGSESAANATGGPRVITHKGLAENEWAATQAHPAVHHNDVTPTGSMFGITASNPDYEPDPSKQNHHYTPFVPPKQKLADTIKLKLDNRMLSLHQAFQHLDTTNCGYITQNELLNACWYWGIRLEPKDFSLLANEYYSGGQSLTGDSRIAYNQFTDIMTKILHPTEEDKKRSAKTVDDIMRSKLLSNGLTMRQTFSEFDKNGSGSLERNEVECIFNTYNIPHTEEQMDELYRDYDSNRDGKFQYSEFVKLMQGVVST